jgi:MoaA/NifB/PqqE/SkfB family radical SAM enzyme
LNQSENLKQTNGSSEACVWKFESIIKKLDIMKYSISTLVNVMAGYKLGRKLIQQQVEKQLKKAIQENKPEELQQIKQVKYLWTKSLLLKAIKNLDEGNIDLKVLKKLNQALIEGAFHSGDLTYRQQLDKFKAKNGVDAPAFFVISPTKHCNLNCKGCYASSNARNKISLPYDRLYNFIKEFHDNAFGRFIVFSGGEPLMYKENGKTLTDLAAEFPDMFFMFYTNGTLINDSMAQKMAQLGNFIPCISVEGYEKETDERRGKGVFKKIQSAMAALRKHGVPFALSVTSTSQNVDILLEDRFYEYYFDQMGASFMWQFQFMPIGKGRELFDLMPTPEQRLKLYHKWEALLHKKYYPVADFWNSGVLTDGCIAYGRRGGYLYIDWNGNVMPCVFVPYVADNIYKAQDEGRNIVDILKAPMLQRGRKWQSDYGLSHLDNPDNLLMPCSIRDHYDNFRKNILKNDAKGEDNDAEAILSDESYYHLMNEYDKKFHQLTDDIWKKEYLKQTKQKEHDLV